MKKKKINEYNNYAVNNPHLGREIRLGLGLVRPVDDQGPESAEAGGNLFLVDVGRQSADEHLPREPLRVAAHHFGFRGTADQSQAAEAGQRVQAVAEAAAAADHVATTQRRRQATTTGVQFVQTLLATASLIILRDRGKEQF